MPYLFTYQREDCKGTPTNMHIKGIHRLEEELEQPQRDLHMRIITVR